MHPEQPKADSQHVADEQVKGKTYLKGTIRTGHEDQRARISRISTMLTSTARSLDTKSETLEKLGELSFEHRAQDRLHLESYD